MEYCNEKNFEAALKSSRLPEIFPKSTQPQQVAFDDLLLYGNGINGVSGDDFFVDDLLDFSNEDFKDGSVEEEEDDEKDSLSVSSQDRVDDDNSNSSTLSGTGDFGSFPADELAVPADDMADLEWLSQFVDDSVPESLLFPAENLKYKTGNRSENRFEPVPKPAILRTPCFPTPVPAKARSKRSRTNNGRVWSLVSPSLSESSSVSSSSSVASSTSCLIFTHTVQNLDLFYCLGKPPAKKQKKRPATSGNESGGFGFQRRCSHCQVQKTPQWRTGPLGAKTLCNACGVRYKSGRLFPEYRPACSPTFSDDVHSNSHRKVLEMRRKKEVTRPESGLTQMMVPSY